MGRKMLESIVYGLEKGTIDIRDADLSGLDIKPKTVEAIQALKENSIKELKLSTDLNIHDILHLSQALATNTSLESLDLSGNNFASNSCLALGRALEHNGSLRKLDLSKNNRVDAMAVENFLIGAQNNTGLRSLNLEGNGACSSSCIQQVIQKMPRLVTLYSNIFGTGLGVNKNTQEVMYSAAQNGLFKALKSHYALCNIHFGELYIGAGDDVIYAVVRRNRGTPNIIYSCSPEILDINIHNVISETTLEAAFNFPKRHLSVSDMVLIYRGNSYSVLNELHDKQMETQTANELFKAVRALSLCIYVRDVVLKDTPEADKFGRFCTVMYLHDSEKNSASGVNTTELERAAQNYYRSAPDPFESDIDQAITNSNASLDKWKERRMREVQALEDDLSRREGNPNAGWGHF